MKVICIILFWILISTLVVLDIFVCDYLFVEGEIWQSPNLIIMLCGIAVEAFLFLFGALGTGVIAENF